MGRLVWILVVVTLLAGCSLPAEKCRMCERPIPPATQTRLVLADGEVISACCPRCALHYRDPDEQPVSKIEVTDYASGEPLPLDRAFLVEGSRVTPCLDKPHTPITDEVRNPMRLCYDRCLPGLIAFAGREEAIAFAEENGGQLLPPGTLRPGSHNTDSPKID